MVQDSCTDDAKRAAQEIADVVAKGGYTVISGMAKGVDSYAHTACLKAGVKQWPYSPTELIYATPKNINNYMKKLSQVVGQFYLRLHQVYCQFQNTLSSVTPIFPLGQQTLSLYKHQRKAAH
ncbi:DNA-processing protein DprA [Anaerobacillus sp. HL2]|nr:DNA-processing protein DprA [Anaerobacillus sp. HL2]